MTSLRPDVPRRADARALGQVQKPAVLHLPRDPCLWSGAAGLVQPGTAARNDRCDESASRLDFAIPGGLSPAQARTLAAIAITDGRAAALIPVHLLTDFHAQEPFPLVAFAISARIGRARRSGMRIVLPMIG